MGDVFTIGPLVTDWIERYCVIPDGEQMGEPFILTDEMRRFVDHFYAVDVETKRWVYGRGGQLIRPQKWGKGPFSAALICAEAAGPVLPLWNGDELVGGQPWQTPWIQVTAVSEDQTDNVFRALLPMIQLSPALDLEINDVGLTRINLPGGGYIEPVTASARSRLGQRVTFVVQDETHSWVQANGGWQLADNQRRNLAGMKGRFLETTNAFDPVEQSVAQRTFEAKAPGTLLDDAEPPAGSVRNKRERRKVMQAVYGDSWWVDLDRIDAEVEALLEHDAAQAERFFLNRKLASEGAAFNPERVKELVRGKRPPAGSYVVLGVDGARHDDALAVVATDVKTGHQWPVVILERPDHVGDDYEHDLDVAYGAVADLIEGDRYVVWRAYCDDQYIAHLIERWQNRFGQKRFLTWHTNRPKPIAYAVRRFEEAIAAGDVSFDANPVFLTHLRQARKRMLTVLDDKQRQMHTLSKDHIRSPRKIDAAMAAVLSWEARSDALASGLSLDALAAPEPAKPPDLYRSDHAPDLTRSLTVSLAGGPMGEMS